MQSRPFLIVTKGKVKAGFVLFLVQNSEGRYVFEGTYAECIEYIKLKQIEL